MEILQDLLEARLAHLQGDGPVAEEARAPDTEHRLTAVHAGGGDEAQEGLHLLDGDGAPAFL